MSSNTFSMGYSSKIADDYQTDWNGTALAEIRQSLLKLALAESNSRTFLAKALELVSNGLATYVSFIEKADVETDFNVERFTVVAQGKPIGALLMDRMALMQAQLSKPSIQEIAEIIALSLVSLKQSEELATFETDSEEMLQYAPDVIFVTSADGTVKMANQKAHELLGVAFGTLVDQNIITVLASDTLTLDLLLSFGAKRKKFELEVFGQVGRRLASFTVSLVNQENDELQMLMVGRDVTTERQAELALRRTERSTLMAQTIDYLLHEVNNPLGALISNISTVIKKNDRLRQSIIAGDLDVSTQETDNVQASEQLEQMNLSLQSAKKAGGRINDAMKILRNANQKRTLSGPQKVDAAFELGLAISALEQEHRKIKVTKSLDGLSNIDAPPLHLAEIFGAVLKNAAEAVEAVSRETRQVLITGGAREGKLVITIEDNGPGVPSDYKDKIFMPFFTTKPLGNSIGLGLPMANDMAKRVGGTIETLRSAKLGGACFRLSFPLK